MRTAVLNGQVSATDADNNTLTYSVVTAPADGVAHAPAQWLVHLYPEHEILRA